MTTIKVKIKGNKAMSSIDGVGVDELKNVLEKLKDGLKWHLEVYSEVTLQKVLFTDPSQPTESDDSARFHGQEAAV